MSRVSLFCDEPAVGSTALAQTAPAMATRSAERQAEEDEHARLLAGVKIPPQPRVLDEYSALMARGDSNVRALAKVLNQDPGMVGLLYKAVSSPTYRRHQPFNSLERILQVVGVQQTYNLARAAAMVSMKALQKNRGLCEAVWARSQAIARFAMIIADERIAVCNIFPDQAYMAGIFHDCGILLLSQRFPGYGADLHLGPPEKWADVAKEDARVHASHAVVGYMVARHWHLPEFVTDAIRFHHDMHLPESHAARTMVAILQLASEFYHREQRAPNPEWAAAKADVLAELGLSEEALPEFADIVAERAMADD